jgi:hypothetical protein
MWWSFLVKEFLIYYFSILLIQKPMHETVSKTGIISSTRRDSRGSGELDEIELRNWR